MPNGLLYNHILIGVADATGFNISKPFAIYNSVMTFTIKNMSGGAMGVITWLTGFKMAAWTNPASGYSRSITFIYDGSDWVELNRSSSDIPN